MSPSGCTSVRIAAKKLRYAMEIERELKRSRITSRTRPLKALQEVLGHLHDLHVLSEQVRAVQAELGERDRRLAADLDGLVVAIEEDCRREHAGYIRRRATILKLCANPTLGDTPEAAVA